MKLYPEYAENIIVYVVTSGIGQWYVTEKELWFLDRIAFAKAFGADPSVEDMEFSKDLSAGNGNMLLREIETYKVSTEDLKELIQIYPPLSKDESVLEMRPSLYVNMDKKVLKNLFPEPSGVFERYAPSSWLASYENFWPEIPDSHTYWCINGQNYFE
jgi:hypothetical protein